MRRNLTTIIIAGLIVIGAVIGSYVLQESAREYRLLESPTSDVIPELINRVQETKSDKKRMRYLRALEGWLRKDISHEDRLAIFSVMKALVSDDDPEIRLHSISAISSLRLSAEKTLPIFVDCLRDQEPYIIAQAADAISVLGPEAKSAAPELMDCLNRFRNESFDRQNSIIRAIKAIEPDPEVVVAGLFETLEVSSDKRVIPNLIDTLAQLSLTDAIKGFLLKLEDESTEVRVSAVVGLRLISPAPELVDAGLAALENDNVVVRRYAIGYIGDYISHTEKVVPALLVMLADDPDYMLRYDAAKLLAQAGDEPGVIEGLIAALNDETRAVRNAAAKALGEIGVDPGLQYSSG